MLARLHRLSPALSAPLLLMGLTGALLLGRSWWRERHPGLPALPLPEAAGERLRREGPRALEALGQDLAPGLRLRSAYLYLRRGEPRWSLELETGGRRVLALYTPADGRLQPQSEVSAWESELVAWHSGSRGGPWRLLPLLGLLSLGTLGATGLARWRRS